MAISLVGVAEGANIDGADVTISLPAGLQQNDLVCVFGGFNRPAQNAGVSTSGYTEDTQVSNTSNTTAFSYKKMGASPDTSVTCLNSGNTQDAAAYVVMAFRGVDTTTPIDAATVTTSGNLSQPNSASITTVTDGAAVISFVIGNVNDTTVTAPTGYGDQVDVTQSDTKSATTGGAWKAISSHGAENPAGWTNFTTTTIVWDAYTVALRPAAAGVNSDADFSSTGTGTATFVGAVPTEGRLEVTGTGTATLVGAPYVSSPFSATGTAVVVWAGNSFSSLPAPFSMTGSGTAAFVGALAGAGTLSARGTVIPDFSGGSIASVRSIMTGLGQVQWVGAVSHFSSVREDIRSRGAATITMGHNVG